MKRVDAVGTEGPVTAGSSAEAPRTVERVTLRPVLWINGTLGLLAALFGTGLLVSALQVELSGALLFGPVALASFWYGWRLSSACVVVELDQFRLRGIFRTRTVRRNDVDRWLQSDGTAAAQLQLRDGRRVWIPWVLSFSRRQLHRLQLDMRL